MTARSYKNPVADTTPWYLLPKEQQLSYIDNFCPSHLVEDMYKFVEDGFLIVKNSITYEVCDEAIKGFSDLVLNNPTAFSGVEKNNSDDPRAYGNQTMYHRIGNTHLASKRIANAFTSNKALEYVNFMFRSKPALYTSLYYQRGSAQEIHRDTPYFTTSPMHYYVGFSISLEESNSDNGCLEVMKGGHLIDELDLKSILKSLDKDVNNLQATDDETWITYQSLMKQNCLDNKLTVTPAYTNKGDTLIWHPQLPHGGSIIKTANSRNSLINHVTPVGMPVYLQDVFFNENAKPSQSTNWQYREFENCYIRNGDSINLNNVRDVQLKDLKSDIT